MSVTAENRPKILFPLKPSKWHVFRDSEKNVIPDSEVSKRMAIGIAETGLELISQALLQYSNEEYSAGLRKVAEIKQSTNTTNKASSKPQIEDLDDIAL